MTEILSRDTGLLFMKVGTHAQEPLDAIIARKSKEIRDAGYSLWGYGGTTCHPRTMVQPFARSFEVNGGKILLCMHEMDSKHYAPQVRADEFSVDGLIWKSVHPAINVLGSRYALVIKNLHKESFKLLLDKTVVAIGNSQGRIGSQYIQGRVDKACLTIVEGEASAKEDQSKQIDLVAEVVAPYAVFLKNNG